MEISFLKKIKFCYEILSGKKVLPNDNIKKIKVWDSKNNLVEIEEKLDSNGVIILPKNYSLYYENPKPENSPKNCYL